MMIISKYLGYNIYIWLNENNSVEPIHVRVAKTPSENADKFWLTESGLVLPDSSNKMLSKRDTAKLVSYLSDEYIQDSIKSGWLKRLSEISIKSI